jgi:hypothetical protein
MSYEEAAIKTKMIADMYLKNEKLREQVPVLLYELGDLSKAVVMMDVHPKLRQAYTEEARLAVADLLAQLQLFCIRLNIDLPSQLILGVRRFADKWSEITRIEKGET